MHPIALARSIDLVPSAQELSMTFVQPDAPCALLSRPRTMIALLLLTASLAGLGACGRKAFTERPAEGGTNPSFETPTSTIGATVSLPISELTRIVNEQIPKTFSDRGNGEDACVNVGYRIETPFGDIKDNKKVCAGTRYEFSVNRGEISIAALPPSAVRFTMPVSFFGKGGFRGAVASAIKLDAKNFDGALTIHADLSPRMTEDWCPLFDVAISYDWTSNPRVEIVDSVNIDVKGQVESALQKELPKLIEKARTAVDCGAFKQQLAQVYGSRTIPIELPDAGTFHVNLEPTDIAFSGLQVDASSVRAAALLTAKVAVSTTAIEPTALPLPKLKETGAVAPRMAINLPMRVPYKTLSAAASRQLDGKTFEQDTPAGKVVVTTQAVSIYPSGDRLVVGVDFSAKLPGKVFDTKGSVFVLGVPKAEGGTKISLDKVDFSQTLDNELWNAVAATFRDKILSEIRNAAAYDLTAEIEKAKLTLNDKLKDPQLTKGWAVSIDNPQMGIARIAVATTELVVEGQFAAAVAVTPKL